MPNINKVVYGNTTLIDLTDSTLSSTDQLAQGITAYDRSGTKITGTASGGSATLITKNITANGTYNASSDNADGYSSVTVNVSGGGSSRTVIGTFTGTTTGAAMDVNIPYTGSGYPMSVLIFPSCGPYAGTFHALIQRYVCAVYAVIKSDTSVPPHYTGSSLDNGDSTTTFNRYKNSTSNRTSYSNASSSSYRYYVDEDATSGSGTIVKIRSKNKMSVFIAGSSYGFADNIEYTYIATYSS